MQDSQKGERLAPEQEAELVFLLKRRHKLHTRMVTPMSNLISIFLIPHLYVSLFESRIEYLNPLRRWLLGSSASVFKYDEEYSKYHYHQQKESIEFSLQHFRSLLQKLLGASKFQNKQDIVKILDTLAKFQPNNFKLDEVRTSFAQAYKFFTCINLQNDAQYSALKCYYSSHAEQLRVVTEYAKKSLSELYTLASSAVEKLEEEIKKYPPDGLNFQCSSFNPTNFGPLQRHLLIRDLSFIAATSLTFETFLVRPSLVKLIPFFPSANKLTNKEIFSLTATQAQDWIATLKEEQKSLTTFATLSDYFQVLITFTMIAYFFYLLINKGNFAYLDLAQFVGSLVILTKDIILRLYQRNLDSRLDTDLKQQQALLDQISRASSQSNWVIHKGVSLDTSYLVLSIDNKKSSKETCDVVKYGLLIHNINLVADGRDCIVVSGNEKLDQKRLTQAAQNIRETLDRSDKLKTLKKQFQTMSAHMDGEYTFYLKRDKHHSLVAVFMQKISVEHLDIITLESCKKIFHNHKIKVQDGKLIIAGFESLGVASQNYKLLFSRKNLRTGLSHLLLLPVKILRAITLHHRHLQRT